jgi:pimeloyl-ACP methyl ester carboxylesterase
MVSWHYYDAASDVIYRNNCRSFAASVGEGWGAVRYVENMIQWSRTMAKPENHQSTATLVSEELFAGLSGRSRLPTMASAEGMPLIIAIHGGSYTSAYFDVAGYSLMDRAGKLAIPIIAPDRPGYGDSQMLPPEQTTIRGQAHVLATALDDAWQRYGANCPGIVLIGHSIGAAIATTIAAENDSLPLLGLAISGVGVRTPAHFRQVWDALPDTPLVDMPLAIKNDVMFGPPGSFDAVMPDASHVANALAPRAELIDIVNGWTDGVHETLASIRIPVHYRQGEIDKLWIVSQDEVDEFSRALSASPRVDAAMWAGTGHCIDFHRVGVALQIQQLGFALQCAREAG